MCSLPLFNDYVLKGFVFTVIFLFHSILHCESRQALQRSNGIQLFVQKYWTPQSKRHHIKKLFRRDNTKNQSLTMLRRKKKLKKYHNPQLVIFFCAHTKVWEEMTIANDEGPEAQVTDDSGKQKKQPAREHIPSQFHHKNAFMHWDHTNRFDDKNWSPLGIYTLLQFEMSTFIPVHVHNTLTNFLKLQHTPVWKYRGIHLAFELERTALRKCLFLRGIPFVCHLFQSQSWWAVYTVADS